MAGTLAAENLEMSLSESTAVSREDEHRSRIPLSAARDQFDREAVCARGRNQCIEFAFFGGSDGCQDESATFSGVELEIFSNSGKRTSDQADRDQAHRHASVELDQTSHSLTIGLEIGEGVDTTGSEESRPACAIGYGRRVCTQGFVLPMSRKDPTARIDFATMSPMDAARGDEYFK